MNSQFWSGRHYVGVPDIDLSELAILTLHAGGRFDDCRSWRGGRTSRVNLTNFGRRRNHCIGSRMQSPAIRSLLDSRRRRDYVHRLLRRHIKPHSHVDGR
jgi:hypothetical protein